MDLNLIPDYELQFCMEQDPLGAMPHPSSLIPNNKVLSMFILTFLLCVPKISQVSCLKGAVRKKKIYHIGIVTALLLNP